MPYQVIARKYRPQTFAEIVGQPVSVRTLQNAIRRDRASHAYLFSGPRGVGKTTMARILAKALNCHQGPTPEPCGQCPACEEIARGNAIDVLEIDAASNRGIDEIRELRDSIPYGPARDRYKVFIVDEAHMLTNEAFNALLKTLEEPPAHAVFILATTEKQKVPITIISRCQPFDFQLISTQEIAERMRVISAAEQLPISERAIERIAVAGEGSLRDALSLLDQIVNFAGAEPSDEDVAAVLGDVDFEIFDRTTVAMAEARAADLLQIVADVSDSGYDLQHFCRRLQQHLRNLLVCRAAGPDTRLLNLPESRTGRVAELARFFSQENLLWSLEILARTEGEMRWAYEPRLLLELALVKMSYLPRLQPIADILAGHPPPAQVREAAPGATAGGQAAPEASAAAAVESSEAGAAERFRSRVKEQRPVLDSWLDAATSLEFREETLHIYFPRKSAFHFEQLNEAAARRVLEDCCREVFGETARLVLELQAKTAKASAAGGQRTPPQGADPALEKIKEEPVLRSFLEAFPGKVSIEEKES